AAIDPPRARPRRLSSPCFGLLVAMAWISELCFGLPHSRTPCRMRRRVDAAPRIGARLAKAARRAHVRAADRGADPHSCAAALHRTVAKRRSPPERPVVGGRMTPEQGKRAPRVQTKAEKRRRFNEEYAPLLAKRVLGRDPTP